MSSTSSFRPSGTLTAEDCDRYWRDGYLLLRGLIDSEMLARIDARFLAIVSDEVPVPESMVLMRDVHFVRGGGRPESLLHAINKILSFEDDPVLWAFATDARVLNLVRDLLGHNRETPGLKTLSTNVFNKPPGVDGRHPLHQDLRYFALRPADGIVAVWTAIQPCTRENGCLAVIPGSHHGALIEHGDPDWDEVNLGFFAADGIDLDARVHVEMEPGDTLLFHPLLVHGSGRNRSEGFRRAISVHYASAECVRPTGMRGSRTAKRRIGAAIKDIPTI
jgi:phytanoyl-CoA hydroxylase